MARMASEDGISVVPMEHGNLEPKRKKSHVLQGWKAQRSQVCVPYRVAAECAALVVIFSWALTMYMWYRTAVGPSCAPPHAQAGVGRSPVAIVSVHSRLAWSVDEKTGTIHMSDRVVDEIAAPPSIQAFHLEWQTPAGTNSSGGSGGSGGSGHFCLRYLRNMRLVEAVRQGQAEEFMLRLSARYSCSHEGSFFSFRGRSLYSLGVGSLVNYREYVHVRAHGDVGPPWKPLVEETARTQVSIEPLPDRRDYVERSLIDLIGRLEQPTRSAAGGGAGVGR